MDTTAHNFPAGEGAPDSGAVTAADWPRRELTPLPRVRAGGFQVVIQADVLAAIRAHGRSILDMEICGFLIGNVFQDDHGPWLHITGSIEGRHATHHAAQVTFTSATWDYAHTVLESRYPDQRIVGWYHTHPNFGVFLSGMDLFIQEHFFNLPWQVAMVYDPVQDDEGVFIWQDGKTARVPHISHSGGWRDEDDAVRLAPLPADNPQPGAEAQRECAAPPPPADSNWWDLCRRAVDRFFN